MWAPLMYWASCKSVQEFVHIPVCEGAGLQVDGRFSGDSGREHPEGLPRGRGAPNPPKEADYVSALEIEQLLLFEGAYGCPFEHPTYLMTGNQWLVLPPRGESGPDQAPEGGPAASTAPQKRYVLPILTLSGHGFPAHLLPQSNQSPHFEVYMRLLSPPQSALWPRGLCSVHAQGMRLPRLRTKAFSPSLDVLSFHPQVYYSHPRGCE